jgi:putative membrane protein
MIDDHTKAGDQLKSIAAKDNITLPSELDRKDKAMVDRFSKTTGTQFDRVHAHDLVKDDQSDVAAFEKETNNGNNPDLKNFASSTVPALRDPLRFAKDNERALGITSSRENPDDVEST